MYANLFFKFYKNTCAKIETVIWFPWTYNSQYVVHDFPKKKIANLNHFDNKGKWFYLPQYSVSLNSVFEKFFSLCQIHYFNHKYLLSLK